MDTLNTGTQVTLKTGTLSFNGWLMRFNPLEGADMEIDTITELGREAIKLSEGKKFCILVDANRFMKSSPEAREFAARRGQLNDYLVARAIMTTSLPMKIASNFFIRFNKPVIPTRLFTHEREAIQWLEKKYKAAAGGV